VRTMGSAASCARALPSRVLYASSNVSRQRNAPGGANAVSSELHCIFNCRNDGSAAKQCNPGRSLSPTSSV
jgi:hypothetical protein